MSHELFERIVGFHGMDAAAKSAVLPARCRRMPERRAVARVSFGKRAQIRRDSGTLAGKWETVMFHDISRGGIGMLCDEPMQPGESFIVRLPQRDGKTSRIRCTARRCERGGFGGVSFLVGATFEQMMDEPSIRLNEDDGQPAEWNDAAEQMSGEPVTVSKVTVHKPARGGLLRAVFSLLRAFDPIRNAVQWFRRHDDFSST